MTTENRKLKLKGLPPIANEECTNVLRVTDSVKKQICQRFVHLTKNFRRKKIHGNSENMSVEVRAELTSFHESRMVFMNIFSYGTVFLFPIPLSLPLSYPVWYPPSLTFPTHFPHHSITSPPSLPPPSPLPPPSLPYFTPSLTPPLCRLEPLRRKT